LDKALEFYEKITKLLEQLYQDHPEHTAFKDSLAINYLKLGETYSSKGDLDKPLGFFKQYKELQEQLHQDYPQHIGFKNGLAVSLAKLGQYSQKQDKGKTCAKDYFKQAQQLWQEINRDCPGHIEYQHNLNETDRILADLDNPNNDD
jgi:tetratricopeptide (TPR) repeat protein